MIDTDKYEGHTEGPWEWDGAILTVEGKISTIIEMFALTLDEGWVKSENLRLIADAPLLLRSQAVAYNRKCRTVIR